VYDAMVRMAQSFSLRYPLVDGQGNYGSVDGDPPAAMRYTEARLANIAQEMLADIDLNTVDFSSNCDDSIEEPVVLPSRLPNMLLNGATGIAVGMATNIPPHNLIELINAVVAQANNPGITLDELMTHMPGPDFPTGGFITGKNPIREAYETGRGIIKLRAKARIEKQKKGDREVIIVNEIPYQVNKYRLIERIADLVKEDKIKGISDIRDESDRDGIRIVVDIKRGEIAEVVLNQLYKHTPMDTSFGIIMLALVRNQPRVMPLKEMINHFIEHRKEVVTRRTQFELAKAEARLHILEGLKIALDHLDEVIALIRKSASPQVAKDGLMQELGLSDMQGQAILEMRLQRLTALERDKILDERKELIATVKRLNELLDKENLILGIVTDELKEIKDRYGDVRKTEIVDSFEEISIEDLIADEDMVVTITHDGYIKTTFLSIYRSQRRGGKGRTGMTTKDMDFVEDLFIASQHNYVLFFSNHGKCYWLKVHEIPEAGPTARGKALINLLNLAEGEKVAAVLPVIEFKDDQYIIMATKNGIVKKTKLMAYSKPRVGGIIALNIRDDDELIEAKLTSGNDEILISSHFGQAIRFKEEKVRDMGRTATGVRGIRLDKGDQVVSFEVIENSDAQILTVTEKGYGKRTLVSKYRITGRGGKGVITIKTTGRNGRVVGVFQVTNDTQIMMITTHGGKVIRMNASEISVFGRGTQGVKLIGLAEDEMVASVAKVVERE
ncbi:MAG: DNA gyrase subunit A, partial [Candidatus Dadabacteria bacterium]|nr:DNA gyrase subunit A [Candidatus Dadabacteria bacterium]